MSHKTEIKTELNNKQFLKKALEKLGFKYSEAKAGEKLQTRGNYGVNEDVDIRIEGNGSKNYNGAIGFKQGTDGKFTAIGDFYGLRTADGKSVTQDMLKCEVTAYSKDAQINERLNQMGFVQNPGDYKVENGKIKVQYRRWV